MSSLAAPMQHLPAIATAAILGGAVICCGLARQTGYASNAPAAPAAVSYQLTFSDLPDGSVAVYRPGDNRILTSIPPRAGAFLRTTIRALDGVRARENINEAAPFKLSVATNDHLNLTDMATGQMIDLEAFGPSNEGQFAQLLRAAEPQS